MLEQLLIHQPYRMVVASSLSLLIYLSGIFFIRFIYPKKKIPYSVLLIGLSILPTINNFRPGVYESGDFTIHVVRAISFYDSLKEGILIPRWAADYNAHYGYAEFNYIHPLPYYFTSFFHLLGFGYINSVKLLLATTYVLSGLFMYKWLKLHFNGKSAFLGSVLYLFAPYHLVDMHFRAHIGETTVFMLLPLCFLFVDRAIKKGEFLWIFLAGISMAMLVLSHPSLALLAITSLFFYTLMRLGLSNLKGIAHITLSFFLGLLFSAFYWIPFFLEKLPRITPAERVVLGFPKFSEILYSPWRFGMLFQGPQGELSPSLGYAHWIVIIIALYLLIFKGFKEKKFIFFLFTTLILLFMLQEISRPIWDKIIILKSMMLPYRLLAIAAFSSSSLASIIFFKSENKMLYKMLVVLAVFSTILNWGNRGTIPEKQDKEVKAYLPYMYYAETPQMWESIIPDKPIETVDGELEIIEQTRSINKHQYLLNMKEGGLVRENTYYFPGWKLYIDGVQSDFNYKIDILPRTMFFYLKSGIHQVTFVFSDTPVRFISNLISFSSLFISGLYLTIHSKYQHGLPTSPSPAAETTTRTASRKPRSTRPGR